MKKKKILLLRKLKKTILQIAAIIGSTAVLATSTFAASGGIGAPSNVDVSGLADMVSIIFWVVRIIILAAGLVPSLPKIVSGIADDNPRDRNSGLMGALVTAAVFAASFWVETLFK